MSEGDEIPEDVRELIDDYIAGALDGARLRELESRLRADAAARNYFVRFCRLHTDLALEARARQAAQRALQTIDPAPQPASAVRLWPISRWIFSVAAALLFLAVGWWVAWSAIADRQEGVAPGEAMAWLVNGHNCQWAEHMAPAGDMQAGKVLRLHSGLAEVRFQKGARLIMEGPARLEIISANSARLERGKVSAKVPESAKGFQIITPKGKVIDLGTEFALAVDEDGTTDVYVFSGKVEAYSDARKPTSFMSVHEKQAARIGTAGVALTPPSPSAQTAPFVRDIPVIVPRTFALEFARPIEGTLADHAGSGTGLTHRLPGTGRRLKSHDENLTLNSAQSRIELTTTNSDLNTQYKLDQGEYLGIKLADLGFTGEQDFALTVVVLNIPALQRVGQFGLYAGIRSDHSIRGGLLSRKEPEQYRQFLVQNEAGKDALPHFVGLTTPGDDLRLTLRREGKQYSLTIENLTNGLSSTLTMPQPAYLEGERDLYVGFFGANTQSEVRRTLILKEFKATIWTMAP